MSIFDSIIEVAEDIYNDTKNLVNNTSHQIHIANDSSEEILVFVAPNKDWCIADLVTDVASFAVGGYGIVKSVADLWAVVKAVKFIGTGVGTALKAAELATLKEFFEKHSLNIPATEVIQVFDQTKLNPLNYLSPSGWGTLLDASDMSLIIVNKTLEKRAAFNTNSDWSWIVTQEGIVRAKYKTLWQEDRDAGFYSWGTDNL
ncbi:MAG: hypothetical protein ACLFT9_23260 [Coleofasciculus sp.]